MASKTLANFTRGMDRQRLRATPKDGTFYNLLNCYVTASGTIKKRPGFRKIGALNAGTKGLFSNDGALRAFYTGAVITPAAGLPIEYDALQPADPDLTLKKVWADYLYLGRQYVAAEFSDGSVSHFWLPSTDSAPTWKANQQYNVDAVVQPTVPNGYSYKVSNSQFPAVWQANQEHAVGDVVVPTVLNGWKFTCIEADGAHPASGSTEPTWPTSDGATVSEEINEQPPPAPAPLPPTSDPGGDRYGNVSGGGGGGGSLPSGTTTKQL